MDVSFDKADVEAAGSAKPWTHRDEFAAEVDTEHMADTASTFARAANEARNAGELAERATRIGQQAGVRNGAAFVEDDRIDVTAGGLQGNGEGIDNVVRMLVRAMNRAMEAREEVDAQIDGGNGGAGMQQVLEHNSAAAVQTWERAQQFFASQPAPSLIMPAPAIGSGTPRFNFNNVEYEGVPSDGAWTAPPNLPGDIRDSYLNMTADEAAHADEEITDAIRQYRQKLAEYGAELEEAGYDTSRGPLDIWRSDEMAAFNGEEVKKLLSRGNPDPELLARYTAGLDSIADDMNDKKGARPPTPEQQAYLNAFFGKVGTEDLLAAGRLKGPSFEPFQESLANGVVAASTGPEPLSSVREFFEKEPISDQGKDGHSVRLQAERFGDFGALMGHASITPSENFSTSLINAAIDAQKDHQSTMPTFEKPPLEGAPQLLSLAATNDDAAASFLSDTNRINRLLDPALSSSWADNGRAVGDLMRAGTLPDDPTFTPEERDKLTAGQTLMQFVADNADDFVDHGRDFPPRAETALADIVGHDEYLSRLSATSTNEMDRQLGALRGDGFPLSHADRGDLFSVLMNGEDQTAEQFKADAGDYIEEQARRVFEGADGTGTVTAEMRQLGELSAAVTNAELDMAYQADKRDDERAEQRFNALKTGLSGASVIPGLGGQVFGSADALSNLMGDPEPSAEKNDQLRRYTEVYRRGEQELHRIYDAARDTGYRGMDDTEAATVIPRRGESWPPSDSDDWNLIGTTTGRNRRQALADSLGDLATYFQEGRSAEFARGAAVNDFDGDEEVAEVERGGQNGDWRPS
ncbi:hypothetical protein [Streptomyces litchfieldiae]|uniref:Uncharacterized protein n=1 Tax=Streptomyces litchfieldiae TaxID=3075543 RepID=A0ABU2MQP8_9ACTN|nr:hypothetical protein [Streptomyces sp. DSM 44938]MDT0343957.1 hypothetical protein [Streptomyces sp. DSM 44938]